MHINVPLKTFAVLVYNHHYQPMSPLEFQCRINSSLGPLVAFKMLPHMVNLLDWIVRISLGLNASYALMKYSTILSSGINLGSLLMLLMNNKLHNFKQPFS